MTKPGIFETKREFLASVCVVVGLTLVAGLAFEVLLLLIERL